MPGDGLDEQISAFPRTAPEAILELENDSRNTSENLWEDSEEFLENPENEVVDQIRSQMALAPRQFEFSWAPRYFSRIQKPTSKFNNAELTKKDRRASIATRILCEHPAF